MHSKLHNLNSYILYTAHIHMYPCVTHTFSACVLGGKDRQRQCCLLNMFEGGPIESDSPSISTKLLYDSLFPCIDYHYSWNFDEPCHWCGSQLCPTCSDTVARSVQDTNRCKRMSTHANNIQSTCTHNIRTKH